MSDDQSKWLDDLGDLDWDSALEDWEKNTLVPDPRPPSAHKIDVPLPNVAAPPPVPPPPPRRAAPTPPAPTTARGGLGQLFAKGGSQPPRASAPPSASSTPVAPAQEPTDAPRALDDGDPTLIGRSGEEIERGAAPGPKLDEAMTVAVRDIGTTAALESATAVVARPRTVSVSDAETAIRHRIEHAVGLDEEAVEAFRARASWLEEEARATQDPMEQGRALLGVSELLALVGDEANAFALATEARDLAPSVALAWHQARQLMRALGSANARVELLDAEAAHAPTPAARVHATLMAADILRTSDQLDDAIQHWDAASKLDPSDVRAPAARAAFALSQNQHTGAGSQLAENGEFVDLGRAVAVALELRGASRLRGALCAMPVNHALRTAREALARADVVGAVQAIEQLAVEPALERAALWLSAAFGSSHRDRRKQAASALEALANHGETLAVRPLAARGIELGDGAIVSAALRHPAAEEVFDATDRAALLALSGGEVKDALVPLARQPGCAPLVDALAAIGLPEDEGAAVERAHRCCGHDDQRVLVTLGRLLASHPASAAIEPAIRAVQEPRSPAAVGAALEAAVAGARWDEVCEALSALDLGEGGLDVHKHVAAALIAERAARSATAERAWRRALTQGATHDSVLRAIAALNPTFDLAAELARVAEGLPDGDAAAILLLEAFARRDPSAKLASTRAVAPSLGDDEQLGLAERIHRGAPALGLGEFLAERAARRKGDAEEALRWTHERRTTANDTLEAAIHAVREGRLLAERDAEPAGAIFEEAHRSRPDDVALRGLYERFATEAPTDRGLWREKRAEKTSGGARALLLTEAAFEYERAGDWTGALRAARRAQDSPHAGLWRPLIERTELAAGLLEDRTNELLTVVRESAGSEARRAAYEQLAERAARSPQGPAEALAWHARILDESPHHKASLRHVESALIGHGGDAELARVFEQIAVALDGSPDGEITAHAELAARLKVRSGDRWESTFDLVRLAASRPEPSLWALRAENARARAQGDDLEVLNTSISLQGRTDQPAERAALLVRASEAAARLARAGDARAFLEQAANEDPGNIVTWGFLAEIREHAGEHRAAAEACESLARTSVVPTHQLLAWADAARLWLDEVNDTERGMSALEQCAEIDVMHGDVFERLVVLYTGDGTPDHRLDADLARLLEKRLEVIDDEGERVALRVDLASALLNMGEVGRARATLESALAERPDHTTALATMAELAVREANWTAAEQAYVRLVRLLTEPDEQRAIYGKLAEIYSAHTGNLSRAEVAYREVLKRAPNDVLVLEKLVDLYARQGDTERAAATLQELADAATDPEPRLQRLIELASLHESIGHDARRAEQVLEAARKQFPTSVLALRALAEFYERHRQMPAMHILLDRVANDVRRWFAGGRFDPALFELLGAACELRGRRDAALTVAATRASVEGRQAEIIGAGARAVDPILDDLLAPAMISPALRVLLESAGDALDAVAPLDLRTLRPTPLLPGSKLGTTIGAVATVVGLGALHVLVSKELGRVAIPLGTNPPALLVGEGLMTVTNERARAFVVVRAMKMIIARASAILRAEPDEAAVLISALFTAFNPTFEPQGVDAARTAELSRRLQQALPRSIDPTVGVVALEAAGTLGGGAAKLGAEARTWANRVALLAIGDPNGALDAIAWLSGENAAPDNPEARAMWIARNAEARELMTFSVSDAYAEARKRLGVER